MKYILYLPINKHTHTHTHTYIYIYIYKYNIGCLNIHGNHVIANNSTNDNVFFLFQI